MTLHECAGIKMRTEEAKIRGAGIVMVLAAVALLLQAEHATAAQLDNVVTKWQIVTQQAVRRLGLTNQLSARYLTTWIRLMYTACMAVFLPTCI